MNDLPDGSKISMHLLVTITYHPQTGPGKSAPLLPPYLKAVPFQGEGLKAGFKFVKGQSCIEQGPKEHIATDTGETI